VDPASIDQRNSECLETAAEQPVASVARHHEGLAHAAECNGRGVLLEDQDPQPAHPESDRRDESRQRASENDRIPASNA